MFVTTSEITAAIVELFPSLAYWDQDLEMFVWKEGRDEEIREFRPCDDPMAVRESEMLMQGVVAEVLYPQQLVRVVRSTSGNEEAKDLTRSDAYWAIIATPRQKAKALLLAHGKWTGVEGGNEDERAEFIISISDGFVEYSYPWDLPSDYSIDKIRRGLTEILGCPPKSEGSIREPDEGER